MFWNVKEVHRNTGQLFKAFCKNQYTFHKYYRWRQCSITKLPKYFIENLILPFDKSKDNSSLELTSRQIPLISLLCYRTGLSMLLISLSNLNIWSHFQFGFGFRERERERERSWFWVKLIKINSPSLIFNWHAWGWMTNLRGVQFDS